MYTIVTVYGMAFRATPARKERDMDEELRKIQESALTGVGHPAGEIIYQTNKRTKEIQNEIETTRRKWVLDKHAAKKAAEQQPVIWPPYTELTGQEGQQPLAETEGSSWLDKVVLYTAWVLAIVGFGLGFAATSSLESWQPLIGAVVGAAVGFAVPFGLRRAVEAVVDFIYENLPQLLALVAIMGLGAIGYLVLLS